MARRDESEVEELLREVEELIEELAKKIEESSEWVQWVRGSRGVVHMMTGAHLGDGEG